MGPIYFFPAAWLRTRLVVTAIAPMVEPMVLATSVSVSPAGFTAGSAAGAASAAIFGAHLRVAHFFAAGRFAAAFLVPLLFGVAIPFTSPIPCCGAVYDKNRSP